MGAVPKDFVDLFRFLNARGVEYLIVGGYAVSWHCCPRFLEELELLVNPSSENAGRLVAALGDFGAVGLEITARDLCDPDSVISFGYPPEQVDLLTSMDGVSWDEAWGEKVCASFGDVPVAYIGRRSLVRALRASSSRTDQEDADNLESFLQERDPGGSTCPGETGVP